MTISDLDLLLQMKVNQFYAKETMLLDEGKLQEWLDLLADDVRYIMPPAESQNNPAQSSGSDLPHFMLFNDDLESLKLRVARLSTGLAPGETPRTITQRLVTDILITSIEKNTIETRSSIVLFQVRQRHERFFIGHRNDTLNLYDDVIKLRARTIMLSYSVLPSTISVFF